MQTAFAGGEEFAQGRCGPPSSATFTPVSPITDQYLRPPDIPVTMGLNGG
jgi:hypothetical protein